MALTEGTRLGPYEIQAVIGAGGMGEVYKAHDTRLNRTVAIKVMPDHVSAREDMKARFEREAQTIAGLSHPNICTLHDIGHESPGEGQEPIDFLVLEHIDGETLTDRVARGPIPLAEALEIAIKVADALDKAHKEGVVHRDLKPGNVMLSKTGPKLLDFGLAKWTESGEAGSLAALPTRADVTAKGTMLGTLQYMAPEQIEGKEADARTDVFAFGALLYEMVTGKRAFEGKSQATLISAIMGREPRPMSHLVPVSPPALEHVVERALAKDPDDRWQSAHSLVIQLKWIAYGDAEGVAPVSPDDQRRERTAMIVLAAAVLLATVMAVPAFMYFQGDAPGEPFAHRSFVRGLSGEHIALSPDGTTIAMVAAPTGQGGGSSLYVRGTGELTSRILNGTVDASLPFWSPDSRFIGFLAGGKLKKIDAAGGPVQEICDAPGFTGGAWSPSGSIVFGSPAGLFRVSEEGGTAEQITTVEAPETGHYWPAALPDGEHYLYLAWSADSTNRAIYAGQFGSPDRTRVMAAESNPVYAEPGYLLFHREATIFARAFDAGSLEFEGEDIQLAGGVTFSTANGRAFFDASQTGTLLYFEGAGTTASGGTRAGSTSTNPLTWVDLAGAPVETAVAGGESYADLGLSPDGTHIAITRVDGGSGDIWVIDWRRNVRTRLTLDTGDDISPVWSHDSRRVAFTSYRNGNADVFVKNMSNLGEAEPLIASSADEVVEDWSRDGRYVAYTVGRNAFQDIWVLPLTDGDAGEPFPVDTGDYRKGEPQFSHDGRWLAYVSDESGRFEVYVMSFPDRAVRVQVSTEGGGQPLWSPDGRVLFYKAGTQVMSVAITSTDPLVVDSPQRLFATVGGNTSIQEDRRGWALNPDGTRFLMRTAGGGVAGRGRGQVPSAPTNLLVGAQRTGGRGVFVPVAEGLTVVRDWPTLDRGRR